jgi:hypothetical protein
MEHYINFLIFLFFAEGLHTANTASQGHNLSGCAYGKLYALHDFSKSIYEIIEDSSIPIAITSSPKEIACSEWGVLVYHRDFITAWQFRNSMQQICALKFYEITKHMDVHNTMHVFRKTLSRMEILAITLHEYAHIKHQDAYTTAVDERDLHMKTLSFTQFLHKQREKEWAADEEVWNNKLHVSLEVKLAFCNVLKKLVVFSQKEAVCMSLYNPEYLLKRDSHPPVQARLKRGIMAVHDHRQQQNLRGIYFQGNLLLQ